MKQTEATVEILDWIVMVFWVVGTSVLGLYFQRYVKSTRDYLLAGKRLRWWQIGLAQSADAVDATDFVATTGQGFRTGAAQIGFTWWGMGIGSVLLSRYIVPLLYRTGVYTNAEYLELRYTASLRTATAILQVLYRFVAMGLVVYAMATMFKVIIGVDLWHGVWAAMLLTLAYVFAAGQLGVVMAAIPQVALMLLTSLMIFVCAAVDIGGWQGFRSRLPELGNLVHLAGHSEEGVPGGVYLWGLILTLITYPVVNQTVAQRIVGARSEMDARKGTIASLLPWCMITGISTMVGIMGVVLLPDLAAKDADFIFPLYMQHYLPNGWLGLGVAALVVASMSTGAGIGTAIAGLMTVDIFKYGERGAKSDRHQLRMTRLFATLSIVCGTLFAMLIPMFGGMIPFYVAMTGTFFLPLTVPYVGGALYRKASRGSGMASVAGGIALGCVLFFGDQLGFLPTVLSHPQWRPFWVLAFTGMVFVVWSILENRIFQNRGKGLTEEHQLASILNASQLGKPATPEEIRKLLRSRRISPWKRQQNVDYDAVGIPGNTPWYGHPTTYEALVVVVLAVPPF